MISPDRETLDGAPIALWRATRGADADLASVYAWLRECRGEIARDLRSTGGVLLRGFSALRDASGFEGALEAAGGQLMDYVGGTSPRQKVTGRILTATEVPGSYSIPLHQEMSYTDGAPARIAFFCELPPHQGGETTVGDMRRITGAISGAVADRFRARGGLQLRRNLPLPQFVQDRPGVPKPWTEAFGTGSRDKAERKASDRGWRWQWEADGSMTLWQEVRPATRRHEVTGDEVWYNQVHIFAPAAAITWALADGRLEMAERLQAARAAGSGLIDRFVHADGSEIDDDDALHLFDVFRRAAWPLRWERGDLLILDNVLSAHGRLGFDGPRRVLTGLIRTGLC